jgi:tetratricopeptide (TPR) repeat protein
METLTAPASRKFRALWPYLCWGLLTIALLGWQYHRVRARQARVQFTVRLEGQLPVSSAALLDGAPFEPNGVSGIGWKTLKLVAPNAETFETNLFIWYGGCSLGTINLVHSRGTVQLDIAPLPNRVTISGKGFQSQIQDCGRRELHLPVGEYQLQTAFERFSIRKTISVRRDETITVPIKPSIVTLEINSAPSSSPFRLESIGPDRISVQQTTPAAVTALPTGAYQLTIWRDDYRKVVPVTLTDIPTNRLTVTFEYGKVEIMSDPTEATVREGDKVRAKTPSTFALQPGRYFFRVEKEAYFPTNVSFEAIAGESRQINVTLANIAFTEALENARGAVSGFRMDYTRALSEVERALKIRPNDETALKLRKAIYFNGHVNTARRFNTDGKYSNGLEEINSALKLNPDDSDALNLKSQLQAAKEAFEKRKSETDRERTAAKAEQRRNRPREVLTQITTPMRFNELFEEQTIRYNGSLPTVRAALVQALGRTPKWSIVRNENSGGDILIIQSDLKGLIWRQNLVLVAGQTATNEVVISFKLFHFTLGINFAEQSKIVEDGFMPLHPQYASKPLAKSVESRRLRSIEEIKKRIEVELR